MHQNLSACLKDTKSKRKFVRGINFKLRLHQRKWRRKVDCASILLRTCNEGHAGIAGSPGHLYAGTPATSLQGHTALTYSSGKMCLKNSSYSIVPLWSSSNLNCTWAYKQYVCWVCRRTWKSHTHTSLVQAKEETGNQEQETHKSSPICWLNSFHQLMKMCIYIKTYTEHAHSVESCSSCKVHVQKFFVHMACQHFIMRILP